MQPSRRVGTPVPTPLDRLSLECLPNDTCKRSNSPLSVEPLGCGYQRVSCPYTRNSTPLSPCLVLLGILQQPPRAEW